MLDRVHRRPGTILHATAHFDDVANRKTGCRLRITTDTALCHLVQRGSVSVRDGKAVVATLNLVRDAVTVALATANLENILWLQIQVRAKLARAVL